MGKEVHFKEVHFKYLRNNPDGILKSDFIISPQT